MEVLSEARCDGRDAAALSIKNAKKTKKMEKVRKRDKAKMTENAKKTNKFVEKGEALEEGECKEGDEDGYGLTQALAIGVILVRPRPRGFPGSRTKGAGKSQIE